MNVVVGNLCGDADSTKKTDCRGIDFVYHPPYLDLFVRCSEFIVGGIDQPPTESLSSQLALVHAPQEAWRQSATVPNITLKLKHRFQFDNSVYKIQSITGNEVSAVCIYGEHNGTVRLFNSEDVCSSIISNLK